MARLTLDLRRNLTPTAVEFDVPTLAILLENRAIASPHAAAPLAPVQCPCAGCERSPEVNAKLQLRRKSRRDRPGDSLT